MQILNHLVWGKQWLKNRFFVFAVICLFTAALFGMMMATSAREITVFHETGCRVVTSVYSDPHRILKQAGIVPGTNHECELEGSVLRVSPEFNIKVTVDGQTHETVSRIDRVGNLLKEMGIALGEYDVVTPAADTIFSDHCTIQVQRVSFTTTVVEESLDAPVVYQDDAAIPSGVTAVKDAGKPGINRTTYYNKVVDGEITEQKVVFSTLIQQPQDKIVLRGTAPASPKGALVTTSAALNQKSVSPLTPDSPIVVDENGRPLEYKQCLTGSATAYTAPAGALTATGAKAQVGYIAVDPREIPYGSMLFIRTSDNSYIYGYAKAVDTGGFIHNSSTLVDLYFNTYEDCCQFGRRNVEVYVL